MATIEHHHGAYLVTQRVPASEWSGDEADVVFPRHVATPAARERYLGRAKTLTVTRLVQCDYDYPATARALGWRMGKTSRKWLRVGTLEEVKVVHKRKSGEPYGEWWDRVRKVHWEQNSPVDRFHYQKNQPTRGAVPCEHRGTDGTVDCRDCGKPASLFIQEAAAFLDSLCT